MKVPGVTTKRRFLVPEVVQSSAMDCGPAALKSLLEGHNIPVSYGRLREACQTDVDGTSIDTLEEVACQLGLDAEQIVVPVDHVLLQEAHALPAITVVRLPDGNTHFLVVWNHYAGLVQVMDPASGRRWLKCSRFLGDLYEHAMPVPAADWREWAFSEEALASVRRRLTDLGLDASTGEGLIQRARTPSWYPMACLDASVRAVDSMVRSRAVRRGREAGKVLESLFDKSLEREDDPTSIVPKAYWTVRSHDSNNGNEEVMIRGAVVVRVRGKRSEPEARNATGDEIGSESALSPELLAARQEKPLRPGRELFRLLRADGLLAPLSLVAAMLGSAMGIVLEAVLFRAFLELAPELQISGQRLGALAALLALLAFLLFLEFPIYSGIFRLGRRLETRLRVAFQKKIPRLHDRYFHSRLTSDMAERNHSLHTLRLLPKIGGKLLRTGFELILTAAGIIWLDPTSAPWVLVATALGLGIPFAAIPILGEKELRVRSHVGGLGRFYLDALLGLVTVRAHGAAEPLRSEHEGLLVEWTRARKDLRGGVVVLEAVQSLVGYGLIVGLLLSHLSRGGEIGTVLLLIYWALKLPVLSLEVMQQARQYPAHRNVMIRLLEPLGAPEDRIEMGVVGASESAENVSVSIEGACVRAGGHLILQDIDLEIEAGSHVAIVGPSGAGKTSLFGLLLGWHRPVRGKVLVDGFLLEGKRLSALRSQIAWVDPAVQLWNSTFLENLRYGSTDGFALPLPTVIEQAALKRVLETLPDGHQTMIGEGGGLVSGGEGQRVRLGRALLRPGVRLVLLDEPFRGLNRAQREELLARARRLWRHATMLCVTHDVMETRSFDRVVVMKSGQVVEDANPEDLASDPTSHYRRMLDSEVELQKLWLDPIWRRWQIEEGRVRETPQRTTS